MTALPHPLQSAALGRPAHPAIVCGETTIDYATLADRAARRAAALAGVVGPGDTVALFAEPSIDWLTTFWAITWLGATAAPLDPQAAPAEAEAALRIIDPALTWTGGDPLEPRDPLPERPWPLDETRVTVLTSGTTAAPRPVHLTTAQLTFSAFASAVRLGHLPGDRWLCCLPLHHVGGLSIAIRCAHYQTTALLYPRFDAARVAAALDSGDATLASLTPTMLRAVLDARPERPFPATLRALLVGGARTPADLRDRCRALGAPLATTWGMTEAASQLATRAPGDHAPGAPLVPYARVTAAPDGALHVDGPLVREPLATTDHGHLDRGRVHVTGRRDDTIISGGKNIAPAEIEDTLRRHPAVADAAVIALADPTWGQRPAAALVARGPDRPAFADLRAWCRDQLSPYKAPDRFTWVDALPRDPLGKLRRRALADLRFDRPDPEDAHHD